MDRQLRALVIMISTLVVLGLGMALVVGVQTMRSANEPDAIGCLYPPECGYHGTGLSETLETSSTSSTIPVDHVTAAYAAVDKPNPVTGISETSPGHLTVSVSVDPDGSDRYHPFSRLQEIRLSQICHFVSNVSGVTKVELLNSIPVPTFLNSTGNPREITFSENGYGCGVGSSNSDN